MRSDQFIAWLEGKFAEVGVEKVVPDAQTLADAYRLAVRKSKLQQAIDDALGTIDEAPDAPSPMTSLSRSARRLPEKRWPGMKRSGTS